MPAETPTRARDMAALAVRTRESCGSYAGGIAYV
jgi:hypothetical protein